MHGVETFTGGFSPVDGGADTIFCGFDCRNEETDDSRKVEVIGCHGSVNKPPFSIGTNLTKVESDDGPILLRMHESICGREGKTLISANQARAAGHVVDDVPKKYHGKQRIKLFDGPTIPLIYRQGLCHMKTSYPSDQDLQTLPVHDLTLDIPWNPAHEFDEDDGIAPSDPRDLNIFATKYIMLSDDAEIQDDVIAEAAASHNDSYFRWTATINKLTTKLKEIDWQHMIPCFAWKPQHVIQKTLDCTTQYYRTTSGRLPMRQYFKSRTPALRVPRINERVSTDWIDSSVPSINGGFTGAQVFYRCTSNRIDVLVAMDQVISLTFCKLTSKKKVLHTLSCLTVLVLRPARLLTKLLVTMPSRSAILNPGNRTRTQLNAPFKISRKTLSNSWTALVPLTLSGFMH